MGTKHDAYVRALTPEGKMCACHVNDLTDQSFRGFVMDTFALMGAVVAVKNPEGRPYRTELSKAEAERDV